MEIVQLDGLEPQLFNLIGPLVMNPKVLKANNNYPFKTTERFQWYIAIENNDVTGFVPVEQKSGSYDINNYYIHNDNQEVQTELIGAIKPKKNLYAIVQTKHEATFSGCGFHGSRQGTISLPRTARPCGSGHSKRRIAAAPRRPAHTAKKGCVRHRPGQ